MIVHATEHEFSSMNHRWISMDGKIATIIIWQFHDYGWIPWAVMCGQLGVIYVDCQYALKCLAEKNYLLFT